jgi:hypothetical protein
MDMPFSKGLTAEDGLPLFSSMFLRMVQGKAVPDWMAESYLDNYRPGVTVGADCSNGDKVVVPFNARTTGVTIIGKPGSGKSSLLEHMILSDLENHTPALLIDPHGLLAERIVSLAPASRKHQITLVEPPFGLNLLTCRTPVTEHDDPVSWVADSVAAAVKKLYGEEREHLPRFEFYLRLAVRTLIPSGLTMIDALDLFTNRAFREACLKRVSREKQRPSDRLDMQTKLRQDWAQYDSLRAWEQITYIESIVNRLHTLANSRVLADIVGSQRTTVPFEEVVLDGDGLLIVSIPIGPAISEQQCNFIGALLLCALADRVFVRQAKAGVKPRRFHLYLDEYHRFATSTTEQLLTEGRKFGVGVTVALQSLAQIASERIRNAVRIASTLIVGPVTSLDAEDLAGEFPFKPKPESIDWVKHPTDTVDIKIPTGAPISWLCTNRHSNPSVVAAAQMLFEVIPASRPQPTVTVGPEDPPINQLLVDVMDRKVPMEALAERLADTFEGFSCTEYNDRRRCGYSPARYIRGTMVSVGEAHYETIFGRPATKRFSWLAGTRQRSPSGLYEWDHLGEWVRLHLQPAHREQLLRGEHDYAAFQGADERLCRGYLWPTAKRMDTLSESERLRLQLTTALPRSWVHLTVDEYAEAAAKQEAEKKKRLDEAVADRHEALCVLRDRLRCLFVLCQGLAMEPILVPSGQQERKLTLIVHAQQTWQDARNEFAAHLVNPPQWVAHVKTRSGYHEINLARPIEGKPNRQQLEEVRSRSRCHWATSIGEEWSRASDQAPPPDDEPPTIGRRSPNR